MSQSRQINFSTVLLAGLTLLLSSCAQESLTTFSEVGESLGGEFVQSEKQEAQQKRLDGSSVVPNILFIVADDLGMADLGAFGGEIQTPHIDALAKTGVRLTNFRVAPTCSPTRAMLLSGASNHAAGLGNMVEELAPNQIGQPGYEGRININVDLLPEILQRNGFRTYVSGKWHLGQHVESTPSSRGFDRSFVLMPGGASHFSDMKPAYAPDPATKANYWEDGKKLEVLPADFEYSSQFYVDKLMEQMRSGDDKDPFFALLSFTAPHWPLQAPDSVIDKYKGRYDGGYDQLRKQRLDSQINLGLLPKGTPLAPLPKGTLPWADLPDHIQKRLARSMEIYAAMIDEMDHHIGRLLDYLRESGELDNTFIVFLSDNGAEGHTLDETWSSTLFPKIRRTIDETHDFSFQNMGRVRSYVFYDGGWAAAGAPAYSGYKGYVQEGGVRVPAIVNFPKMIPVNSNDARSFNVRDLYPTTLELAGLDIESYVGPHQSSTQQSTGLSLTEYLKEPEKAMPERTDVMELFGKQSVLRYPWKLIREPEPWGNNAWRLYDLVKDRAEQDNVIRERSKLAEELKFAWSDYVAKYGVILPNKNSGY